jgi:hypothetical protein
MNNGIDVLASFLVQQPVHILGVAFALFLVWMAIRPLRKSMLAATLAWLGYAAWEWLVQERSPEANIRVDLLLIWPLLGLLTVWAFVRLVLPGVTSRKPHA